MGERSATAQKLKQVITTPSKFYNSDQRLYLKASGTKVLGFIKVG
jgi:alpha-tubulin N-acetyltransferase 1